MLEFPVQCAWGRFQTGTWAWYYKRKQCLVCGAMASGREASRGQGEGIRIFYTRSAPRPCCWVGHLVIACYNICISIFRLFMLFWIAAQPHSINITRTNNDFRLLECFSEYLFGESCCCGWDMRRHTVFQRQQNMVLSKWNNQSMKECRCVSYRDVSAQLHLFRYRLYHCTERLP